MNDLQINFFSFFSCDKLTKTFVIKRFRRRFHQVKKSLPWEITWKIVSIRLSSWVGTKNNWSFLSFLCCASTGDRWFSQSYVSDRLKICCCLLPFFCQKKARKTLWQAWEKGNMRSSRIGQFLKKTQMISILFIVDCTKGFSRPFLS